MKNRRSSSDNLRLAGIRIISSAVASLLALALPALSQSLSLPKDSWLVSINVRQIARYIDCPGSTLQTICRADIVYGKANGSEQERRKYEVISYDSEGQPVGCHRSEALNIPEGSLVYVRLAMNGGDGSALLPRCGANAVLRTLVDLAATGNGVSAVAMPGAAMALVRSKLEQARFTALEDLPPGQTQPVDNSVVIHLFSDAGESGPTFVHLR